MNASLKKTQRPVSKRAMQFAEPPVETSVSITKDSEEDFFNPVLDIDDLDNIKKAVIYAEIINRKEY